MKPNFGETFLGSNYLLLNIPLHFPATDVTPTPDLNYEQQHQEEECKVRHSKSEIDHLRHAIRNDYWYKLNIDGLPLWGALGIVGKNPDNGKPEEYIYTHRHISIGYNGNHIVEVSLNVSEPKLLSDYILKNKKYGLSMEMTYSVSWRKSNITPDERIHTYWEPQFFEHQGHWLSLMNSIMLSLFLSGVVVIIITRARQNDIKSLSDDEENEGIIKSHKRKHHKRHKKHKDDDDDDGNDKDNNNNATNEKESISEDNNDNNDKNEPTWKECSKEVWRAPQYGALFSALVGTGAQFLSTLLLLCAYGFLSSEKYFYRGDFMSHTVYFYAASGIVGGIFSSWSYSQHNLQRGWTRPCILTFLIYPGVFTVTWLTHNTIAKVNNSSLTAPFTTHFKLCVLWTVLVVPLTALGSIFTNTILRKTSISRRNKERLSPLNYRSGGEPHNSKRFCCWSTLVNIAVGGAVVFASVISELYFVYSALWRYKVYYTYGYALLTLMSLAVIAGCTGIVCVYRCLCAGEYRWHWVAFLTGAVTGVYVLVYSGVYFVWYGEWSGFYLEVFGTVTITVSVAMGLLCGFSGYFFSVFFVRKLYNTEKTE